MNQSLRVFLPTLVIFVLGAGPVIQAQTRKPGVKRFSTTSSKTGRIPSRISAQIPAAQRRIETFLKVWQTIHDNYFDPTFNGLNWYQIKTEYEPRVKAAQSDGDLHTILHEMINRLNRSHLAIIPPEVYQAIEKAKVEAKAKEIAARKASSRDESAEDAGSAEEFDFDDPLSQYGIGVDLRLLNEQFVITRIAKDSAAQYSGLKTGFVIRSVNDVSLDEVVKRITINYPGVQNIKRYLPSEVVTWFLNGDKDSFVKVGYLDEKDKEKEVKIWRELLRSQPISIGSNFPDRHLIFETASLTDEIGYIKFSIFAVPVIEKFCASMTQLKDKKAIIIDLRGNMGGVMASLVGLGGMLTDRSIDLGTSIFKTGSENLIALSKAKNFKGKIVFLVDNQTVSAAEVFAVSMQENKRALIVGEKTAGEALPSIALQLPTGAVMLYPIANYKSVGGKFLEGNGVEPDFRVALTRKALLEGKDDQLQMALSIIKDDRPFPTRSNLEIHRRDVKNPITVSVPHPPPPKPKPERQNTTTAIGKVLATVEVKAPPPPLPVKPAPKIKDAESVKVIGEFVDAIGGAAALRKVNSYELHGRAELLVKGTKNNFKIDIYRGSADKYSEIMKSDAAGEIREVYNGKAHFVQTDYGLTKDLGVFFDVTDVDILSPIRTLYDENFFESLTHKGVFEREGRKVNLIDAKSKDGMYVALAFDVETKMLVSFTGAYYGLSFGDFRRVGDIMLPFRIEREKIMNIVLDDVKINSPIDPTFFRKKENCFDIAN